MTLQIRLGLAPEHRPVAARIYWEAFGSKLGRVMGPEPRAMAYLARVMRSDHAITAVDGGELVGLAGFKTAKGAFAEGGWPDMRATYGLIGAGWRMALLAALSHEVDNQRFLVDGICVARDHRGRGIGRALVEMLCAEAEARGHDAIRLEVIDTNIRARALYERLGFRVIKHDRLGLLRHAFGFESAATMVCELAEHNAPRP
ncbi:molybdopterin-guanine dinucleotide biosynthesis protein MobC [Gemmobacter lanyuensis]|uniref:Molybdopterin-guanine dinucleotide biosynthesis protein MobC n=1 Tax=Gemmobacter lanyuensis TaxID=1054497 RepID=A0A918MHG7_9RHOB|nr:GNAT family N-acetyltransferase [Gemmobacter lanyuensis]GGW25996.1 molybdopterin-guanine dinucleotide biosynthesis protein MobC [Gemmobacter lanyuensis]